MKTSMTNDNIRTLQKHGEFRFEGLSRAESREAAGKLARAAMADDRERGIDSRFGIARDVFGYYRAVQLER